MGKNAFLYFIRDSQGRKRKVRNGYLCRTKKFGLERTIVLGVKTLMNAGLLKPNDLEDDERQAPRSTEPRAGRSQSNYERNSTDVATESSSGPADPRKTIVITIVDPSDAESDQEDATGGDDNRPTAPNRRRSDEGAHGDNEDAPVAMLSPIHRLARTMVDIQNKEEAGKYRRLKEKFDVLRGTQITENNEMHRRLGIMLDYLKEAYTRRDYVRVEAHMQKIDRIRTGHKMTIWQRELRHDSQLEKLMASPNSAGEEFERGDKYYVNMGTVFENLEKAHQAELKNELGRYKDDFLQNR